MQTMNVKNDHRSNGFNGIRTHGPPRIPVRCSTKWAMKPHMGSVVSLLSSCLLWRQHEYPHKQTKSKPQNLPVNECVQTKSLPLREEKSTTTSSSGPSPPFWKVEQALGTGLWAANSTTMPYCAKWWYSLNLNFILFPLESCECELLNPQHGLYVLRSAKWFSNRLLDSQSRVSATWIRSPLLGACNSHNKPVQRHFYRPVYF